MSDRISRGKPLTADELNAVVEAVLDRIRAGNGLSLTRTSGGVALSAKATQSSIPMTGGIVIDHVAALPDIPTVSPRIVWLAVDNQLWAACPGQSRWTPLQNWTWLDGQPGS